MGSIATHAVTGVLLEGLVNSTPLRSLPTINAALYCPPAHPVLQKGGRGEVSVRTLRVSTLNVQPSSVPRALGF